MKWLKEQLESFAAFLVGVAIIIILGHGILLLVHRTITFQVFVDQKDDSCDDRSCE